MSGPEGNPLPLTAATLAELLPLFIETVAAVPGTEIADPEAFTPRNQRFYPDSDTPDTPPQLDAIVLSAVEMPQDEVLQRVRRLRVKIHRQGTLFVLLSADAWPVRACIDALEAQGLAFYRGWLLQASVPPLPWGKDVFPASGTQLLRFCRKGYDPVLHARSYLKAMEFGTALSILHDVAEGWFDTDEARGRHAAELLMAYLAQDRFIGPRLRLQHLVSAMRAYTRACTLAPMHVPGYQCMAAFWRGVGRDDLARRLLQTVTAILPSPEAEADLARCTGPAPAPANCDPPAWDPAWKPRILYLCHIESDYGSDLLYDGLRRLLGPENVTEYPWKPTVHGQQLDQAFDYPCTFHWPDPPTPLPDLVRRSREGGFDLILFSDTTGTLPKDEIHQILDVAPPDTPLFVLDMWDECGAFLEDIRRDARLGPVQGYFKREMLAGIDYGPNTWPLTFAYADDRIPNPPQWEGRAGVFFAGKLIGGTRRLTLSWLQTFMEVNGGWGTPFTQEEYTALLRQQLIGLCMFGNGFDTVRYWELPAHGVMMLAERSPLRIPHDFQDGKHAVFYDHALDLREKLECYLAHPGDALQIAQAGHAHLRQHHTATARARQLLGQLHERIQAFQAEGPQRT